MCAADFSLLHLLYFLHLLHVKALLTSCLYFVYGLVSSLMVLPLLPLFVLLSSMLLLPMTWPTMLSALFVSSRSVSEEALSPVVTLLTSLQWPATG